MVKVSVIMPAYNAGQYISKSIESVLGQTYHSWELIIIDDGSTDNTKEIADGYCRRDERIRYLYQENSKQGRARNKGIANAQGEFIAFLDADDLWLPQKLEKQVEVIENSDVDLLFGSFYLFSNNLDEPGIRIISVKETTLKSETGFKELLAENKIPILTVLCKKHAILEVGGFPEELKFQNAEDYYLWLKLILGGFKLESREDVLAAYRLHHSSSTGTDKEALIPVTEIYYELIKKYPGKKKMVRPFLKEKIKKSLYYLTIGPAGNIYNILKRYLIISDKKLMLPLLWIFKIPGSRKLLLRTAYFVFNYLS